MTYFKIIAAFAVGGIATSNLFAIAVPPPAAAPPLILIQVTGEEEIIDTSMQSKVESAPVEPEHVAFATSTIEKKIAIYAKKYGQSAALMRELVTCETAGTFDPNIQSDAIYTFSDPARSIVKGHRERSFGLSQIHLPDNSGITEEQAKDPDFALDFMAHELAMGNTWRWKLCYHGAHQ